MSLIQREDPPSVHLGSVNKGQKEENKVYFPPIDEPNFRLDLPNRIEHQSQQLSQKQKLIAQAKSEPMMDYESQELIKALLEYNPAIKIGGLDPRMIISKILDRSLKIKPTEDNMPNMADQGIIATTSQQYEDLNTMNYRIWIKFKLDKLKSALNPSYLQNNVIEKGRYQKNPIKETIRKYQTIPDGYLKIYQEISKLPKEQYDKVTILKLPKLENCECLNKVE